MCICPGFWLNGLHYWDADMDRRKERMKNECKKIMDSINSMSFVNLDDQRVQSLVMMREIARGVVHNRVEKVKGESTACGNL